jgi:hypothetical protein
MLGRPVIVNCIPISLHRTYLDFAVNNHKDLDSCFCLSLQNMVQPPILLRMWWSSQEQFWTEPPILDVYCFFRCFECNRYRLSCQSMSASTFEVGIPSSNLFRLHTTLHYYQAVPAQMIHIYDLPRSDFFSRLWLSRVLRRGDGLDLSGVVSQGGLEEWSSHDVCKFANCVSST